MPLQALIKVTDTKTNDVFSTFTYFIAVSFPSSQNHFSLLFYFPKVQFLSIILFYLFIFIHDGFFSCFSFSLFSQSAFYGQRHHLRAASRWFSGGLRINVSVQSLCWLNCVKLELWMDVSQIREAIIPALLITFRLLHVTDLQGEYIFLLL